MMRVAGFAALLLLGGCAFSIATPAPHPVQEEILAASLESLRASISGEVVIDPRIAAYDVRPGRGWVGSWPPRQAQAFAAMLGGEVAELEDVVECSFPWQAHPPVERRCVMKGVDVHLTLSRPVVRGDEAAVIAYAVADGRTASLRQPTGRIWLELRRRDGMWAVHNTSRLRETRVPPTPTTLPNHRRVPDGGL
jgi:hypothetical protein